MSGALARILAADVLSGEYSSLSAWTLLQLSVDSLGLNQQSLSQPAVSGLRLSPCFDEAVFASDAQNERFCLGWSKTTSISIHLPRFGGTGNRLAAIAARHGRAAGCHRIPLSTAEWQGCAPRPGSSPLPPAPLPPFHRLHCSGEITRHIFHLSSIINTLMTSCFNENK